MRGAVSAPSSADRSESWWCPAMSPTRMATTTMNVTGPVSVRHNLFPMTVRHHLRCADGRRHVGAGFTQRGFEQEGLGATDSK